VKGIEAMHALRKGQGRIFAYGHSNPDVVIVEKAFTYAGAQLGRSDLAVSTPELSMPSLRLCNTTDLGVDAGSARSWVRAAKRTAELR
jgi:hypothetical protein